MSEHPRLEFAPLIAALTNFTFDVPFSVIYNLYGQLHFLANKNAELAGGCQ